MTALDFARAPERVTGDAETDRLHLAMREADGAWRMARAAGRSNEEIRSLCAVFVAASESYQKRAHGHVRLRVSVAALLR